MTRRKKLSNNINRKGRSETQRFWMLTSSEATSPAFRALSGAALKTLVELHARHNGFNNGEINLSANEGAKKLGMGKSTVHRALKELQEKGFLKLNRKGTFVGRRASQWTLTDEKLNDQPPTNEWRRWQQPKKKKVRPDNTPIGLVSPADIKEEEVLKAAELSPAE